MYEFNGPDIKIRGTASHVAEKYLQLARDAQSSGDPVAAENYYQHAEHYFRLIAAAQEQFRQSQPYGYQQGGDQRGNTGDDGYDDGDEQPSVSGEPFAPREQQPFYPREQHTPNPSRNNFSRALSSTSRRTRRTLNGCRHSSPAAAASRNNSSRSHHRVRPTTAPVIRRTVRMVKTATTARQTASRCIGGADGTAARVIMRCRARVMRLPVRARTTTSYQRPFRRQALPSRL